MCDYKQPCFQEVHVLSSLSDQVSGHKPTGSGSLLWNNCHIFFFSSHGGHQNLLYRLPMKLHFVLENFYVHVLSVCVIDCAFLVGIFHFTSVDWRHYHRYGQNEGRHCLRLRSAYVPHHCGGGQCRLQWHELLGRGWWDPQGS